MNIKKLISIFGLIIFVMFLNSCANNQFGKKPFKHNTPLIKDDIKKQVKQKLLKL